MPEIEVEAKYRVGDLNDIRRRLGEMAASGGESLQQADEYFAHPSRSFAETNEAFRLRIVGNENRLTYKGPLLDATTKTRREIEVAFAPGPAARESMRQLLIALGFRSVHLVEKLRQVYHLNWGGLDFEVCLDQVAALGEFVELETTANEDAWESARDEMMRLAADLNLSESERRSYLELLLDAMPGDQLPPTVA